MVTYYLGNDEVNAYLRELLARLKSLESPPTIWCAVTDSGVELLRAMIAVAQQNSHGLALDNIKITSVYLDDKTDQLQFADGFDLQSFSGQRVLVLDSAIHSGATMARVLRELTRLGVADICTYALVLKRTSSFIPSLWGLLIKEADRAYFLLDRIPNNRLTTHLNEKHPYVHIRKLVEADADQPPVKSGVDSMDRVTWEERWFDMATSEQGRCTYLLETAGKIVGYLTLHMGEQHCLVVDEAAVEEPYRGKGFGGVLLRFADTLARHGDCLKVRLCAIKERIDLYEKFGFIPQNGRTPLRLGNEQYHPMERAVLHHPRPGHN